VKYPAQPMLTVAAPRAYSRMRSQPMIQAINSPRVAYVYEYALPAIGILLETSAVAQRRQAALTIPATTNEMVIDGPAFVADATPV